MRPLSFVSRAARAALAVVLAVSLASAVRADGAEGELRDAKLDRLVGHWNVRREIRGEVVGNTLDARWVLNHRFLELHYRDVKRPMEYEAQVYVGWDEQRQACVAHWLDVFGGRFSETLGYGTWQGDSLVLVFDYPDGRFENSYRWYPERGEWTSRMNAIDSTGARSLFGADRITPAAARPRSDAR